MIKKIILIILISTICSGLIIAQDFPYGNTSLEELNMKKYDKDTSAHAVVLQEYGTSRINKANDDHIKLMFEYHVKVKIFDNKGFDNATVAIALRNDEGDNSRDELFDVSGTTYFTDDNGNIQQIALDSKKVFNTRDYKYQSTSKFTMPGLRKGCIIEYKYRIEIPGFLDHFRPWYFQTDIPKVYSEYEVHIPAHFNYNASLRGPLKLTKSKSDVERECFSVNGSKSDCSDIVYGMANVPAFIEEDYMTSAKNFLSAITFELIEYTNPYSGGGVTRIAKEWRDIDYQLKTAPEFGSQMKRKSLFDDRLVPVLAGKTTDLEKATAVCAYIQKWFKYNDYIGIYSNDGIKKALEEHSGSVADINLALIAALSSAGIHTEAVLLSTRDHGFVNDLFPATNDFNYVVAKATIGDKSYLLDATDRYLAFGMLPKKCLNDKGRVFSLDKPSYWMNMNLPQKENSSHVLDFTLQADGKIKGTITEYSIGYAAYLKRLAIRKFNSTDEYIESLDSKWSKLKIIKSQITNLDSLNLPLGEEYEVEINLYNQLSGTVSFNPFFLDRITTNPFKLAERSYPVDWGMASEDRLVLTMHLPAQYIVETAPKKVAIGLPDNGGRFVTSYEPGDNSFVFSNVIAFNKAIYNSSEYPYLKELYNNIILSEKADMVFKKNK